MSKTPIIANVLLCLLGVSISCYAYYVEKVKSVNKDYRALCDISVHISCSKVFHSEYGRGLGLLQHIVGNHSALVQPNSVYGVIFYGIYAGLTVFGRENLVRGRLLMNTVSLIISVYLGYVLAFILNDFCIVCVSMYVLNIILFIFSLVEYRAIRNVTTKKQGPNGANSATRTQRAKKAM